jgi:hypothetical protein
MADVLDVVLVAREKGSAPIIPQTNEFQDITGWRNGPVEPDQTFKWRWPEVLPVDGMTREEQLAHLPLWCDIEGNPALQAELEELRANPDKVTAARHKSAKAQMVRSPGGFDPFRRHRRPEGKAATPKAKAEPKGEEVEVPEGVSGGKAGWFDIRVGDEVDRVRGREAAEARHAEMKAAAEGDPPEKVRAADMDA